jgi:hypothetical protein
MSKTEKIKTTVDWKGLKIRLFEIPDEKIGYNGLANIRAYNPKDEIIWTVESPKTPYDAYYNMSLDIAQNVLIVISRLSFRYVINPETGRIIEFHMIK